MTRFILRKLLTTLITVVILVLVVFLLTNVVGDPARLLAGAQPPEGRVEQIREELGFNDPILVQLGRQYRNVFTLDFGDSYSIEGTSVMSLVGTRLAASAKLVFVALLLTIPISILGGLVAARFKDTLLDRSIVTLGLASASIPDFVSGVILQYFIGVQLGWLPATSFQASQVGFFASLQYVLLPSLAVVLVYFGYIARVARAGTITAFESDYARTAYMKGLSTPTVVRRHILRNGLQPTVAVIGTQIGFLFGGLVALEVLFEYNGLGSLILNAAQKGDVPLLIASVLTVSVIFMLTTLVADIVIAWMNPRARNLGAD